MAATLFFGNFFYYFYYRFFINAGSNLCCEK